MYEIKNTGYTTGAGSNFLLTHHITRDNEGNMLLIYKAFDGSLLCGCSRDRGISWTKPVQLGVLCSVPFSVCGSNYGVHISVIQSTYKLTYILWNGKKWHIEYVPSAVWNGRPFSPCMLVDREGVVYIVCGCRKPNGDWMGLLYRRHPLQGWLNTVAFEMPFPWSAPDIKITAQKKAEEYLYWKMCEDLEGNLHLVMRCLEGSGYRLYYSSYLKKESGWNSFENVVDKPGWYSIPSFTIDRLNNAHIFWYFTDGREHFLKYRRKVDCSEWENEKILLKNERVKSSPELINFKRDIIACWQDKNEMQCLKLTGDEKTPLFLFTQRLSFFGKKIYKLHEGWEKDGKYIVPVTTGTLTKSGITLYAETKVLNFGESILEEKNLTAAFNDYIKASENADSEGDIQEQAAGSDGGSQGSSSTIVVNGGEGSNISIDDGKDDNNDHAVDDSMGVGSGSKDQDRDAYLGKSGIACTGSDMGDDGEGSGSKGSGSKGNGNGRAFKLPAFIPAVIGLMLCGLAFVSFNMNKPQNELPVVAHECSEDSLVCGIGIITPVTNEIYSKTSGCVEKIWIKPGDSVSTGQLVVSIDSQDVNHELSQVKDDIEKCLLKINSLSQQAGMDILSTTCGTVLYIHLEKGVEVKKNAEIITIMSERILDITFMQNEADLKDLDSGVPVELHSEEGSSVKGELISPVQIERDPGGNLEFHARVLLDELQGVKDVEKIIEAQECEISVYTLSGLLETACEIARAELTLSSEEEGELTQLYVAEGDKVIEGQVLGRITLDKVSAELQAEQIELNKLRNKQQHLEESIESFQIKSPVTGKIKALYVAEGDAVQPDTILGIIENSSCYQVVIPLTEKQAASVLQGMPALLTVKENGKQYKGRVETILKKDNGENEYYSRAIIVLNKEPGLKPGMSVPVELFPVSQ